MIELKDGEPCIKVECENKTCRDGIVPKRAPKYQDYCPDCTNGFTYQKLTQNVEKAEKSLTHIKYCHCLYPKSCYSCIEAQSRLAEIEEQESR